MCVCMYICIYLCAGGVLQIPIADEIDLPAEVVPGVNHLVGEGVLEMAPARELVGAEEDAGAGVEAAALAVDGAVFGQAGGAAGADDVGGVDAAVEGLDALPQEHHRRRVLERPVPPLVAALAVPLLVHPVPLLAVVERPLGVDRPRQDLEVVDPPLRLRVEACPFRVVGYDLGELAAAAAGLCRRGWGWLCLWRVGRRRRCWFG